MPCVIGPDLLEGDRQTPCELSECLAAIGQSGFDPRDEGSLLQAAGWLRRLGHNRDFLADMMLAELAARHRADEGVSAYGPRL